MAGGRKRAFDKQVVLEQAMQVFWQKGYAGTSLADLTSAMGINKPSMYAAFGNKEQLFILAIQNYITNYANKHTRFLTDKGLSAPEQLRKYLLSIVASQTGQEGSLGCFLSFCVIESSNEDMPVEATKEIEKLKPMSEKILTAFFSDAQFNNQLSDSINPEKMAQFYVSLIHGTAAMARAGKTHDDLVSVIDTALLVSNPAQNL